MTFGWSASWRESPGTWERIRRRHGEVGQKGLFVRRAGGAQIPRRARQSHTPCGKRISIFPTSSTDRRGKISSSLTKPKNLYISETPTASARRGTGVPTPTPLLETGPPPEHQKSGPKRQPSGKGYVKVPSERLCQGKYNPRLKEGRIKHET